jgi:hypothetical protein
MDIKSIHEIFIETLKLSLYVGGGIITSELILYKLHKQGPVIKSQSKLEKVVKEEALKLGLDASSINAKLDSNYKSPNGEPALSRKEGDHYQLIIVDKAYSTRRGVKHELYHIFKKDIDHNSELRYWLIEEPRAIVYGALGIKL